MRTSYLWIVLFSSIVQSQTLSAANATTTQQDMTIERYSELFNAQQYPEALQYAQALVEAREKEFGADHLKTAEALNALGIARSQLGDYAKADTAQKRALAIRKRELGPSDALVAETLANLGQNAYRQERFDESESLLLESLATFETAVGKNHPNVANVLNSLGVLFERLGRYEESKTVFNRSYVIYVRAYGRESADAARVLNNIGNLASAAGDHGDAAELFQMSLAILKKKFPDTDLMAAALHGLAIQQLQLNKLADAERNLKRSISINEKLLGPDHQFVVKAYSILAGLYSRQGRMSEAIPLYARAVQYYLKKREKSLDAAAALNSMAVAELTNNNGGLQNPKLIEEVLEIALDIRTKKLGPSHPAVAETSGNIAELYITTQRYGEAEKLIRKNLAIAEKAFGSGHPKVAVHLSRLGSVLLLQDQTESAIPLFERALAQTKDGFEADGPGILKRYSEVAVGHYSLGNWQKAVEIHREAAKIAIRLAKLDHQFFSQRLSAEIRTEADRFSTGFVVMTKAAYRLAERKPDLRIELAGETFELAQWAQKSVTAASLTSMAARVSGGNSQISKVMRDRQDAVREWRRLAQRRSDLLSAAAKNTESADVEPIVQNLAELEKEVARIDQQLESEYPEFSALSNSTPLSIEDVRKHLDKNEALIAILTTPEFMKLPEETYIWVVTKDSIRWVRSGLTQKALKQHVDALRCGLDFEGSWGTKEGRSRCFELLKTKYSQASYWNGQPLPFRLRRAHALYKDLFAQVEDLIADKDLLIVPTGALSQLPMQVLVAEEPTVDEPTNSAFEMAEWLVKRHTITVLPSVSSLGALRAHAKSSSATQPFLGIGNPLLDGDGRYETEAKQARSINGCASTKSLRTAERRSVRSSVLPIGKGEQPVDLKHLRRQAPLPETADELCSVARGAGASSDDILLGADATETNIKAKSNAHQLARYKVVHFATHGALAGELSGSKEPGLILTPPEEGTKVDDGYLSASEAAGLKLDADWVILSACNTASGQAAKAEALSGLARAFFYAGARALLVSHWYVNSHATVELISRSFAMLHQHPEIGRAKALQRAMLALQATGHDNWHPANWAPFVVVGDGGR